MATLLIAVICIVTAGCGGDRLPVAPVEGKVFYNGEPLEFGSVMFQPATGPVARGTIRPDGSVVLSTYADGDGAVIGRHRIRIACFDSRRGDASTTNLNEEPGLGRPLIPQKYLRFDTSGLQMEVKHSNKPFVFELTDVVANQNERSPKMPVSQR